MKVTENMPVIILIVAVTAIGLTMTAPGSVAHANTEGTVSLDRTTYPVPFRAGAFETAGGGLGQHDLTVYIRVDDADFDASPVAEDHIPADDTLEIEVIRGDASRMIDLPPGTLIYESAPDTGVFELGLDITYRDGPADGCPINMRDGCILRGDVLQVRYTDLEGASGERSTVTGSATFDLRNSALQSDKSAYVIGSDMILTLVDPDLDLDGEAAESYTLNLIEWSTDAITVALGQSPAFDPEPSNLRETGDSTGIFQVVVNIPAEIDGERLKRGEGINLKYVDGSPSGSSYVGEQSRDINLAVFASDTEGTIPDKTAYCAR